MKKCPSCGYESGGGACPTCFEPLETKCETCDEAESVCVCDTEKETEDEEEAEEVI